MEKIIAHIKIRPDYMNSKEYKDKHIKFLKDELSRSIAKRMLEEGLIDIKVQTDSEKPDISVMTATVFVKKPIDSTDSND